MDKNILRKIESIEKMLKEQATLQKEQTMLQKERLDFNEACLHTGFSHSHMYKLTSKGEIPFSKPNGKKIYFSRKDLDVWLLRNRRSSQDELDQQAADYMLKRGRVRCK